MSYNTSCPCGLTGLNCSSLASPLEGFEYSKNELCNFESTENCLVKETTAVCFCFCGWSGDTCDDRVVPLTFNYCKTLLSSNVVCSSGCYSCHVVLGMAWGLVLIIGCWFWNRRERLAEQKKPRVRTTKEAFVTSDIPGVSPEAILVYRACMALLSILFYLIISIKRAPYSFVTFTMWNWLLLTIYFILGTFLSARYVFGERWGRSQKTEPIKEGKEGKSIKQPEPLDRFERLHHAILEIELPCTIFIALVVWTILLPFAIQYGQTDRVLNPSSFFSHGLNIIFMLIDFALNKLYISFKDIVFLVSWSAIYGTTHILLMLILQLIDEPHCPVYPFMDMSSVFFSLFLVGLVMICTVFYIVGWKISQLKLRMIGRIQEREKLKEEVNEIHDSKPAKADPESVAKDTSDQTISRT